MEFTGGVWRNLITNQLRTLASFLFCIVNVNSHHYSCMSLLLVGTLHDTRPKFKVSSSKHSGMHLKFSNYCSIFKLNESLPQNRTLINTDRLLDHFYCVVQIAELIAESLVYWIKINYSFKSNVKRIGFGRC